MTPLRVAAFQRSPISDNVDGVLRRLVDDLEWCSHQGVNLALFPECYLQGYATDRGTIVRRSLTLADIEDQGILSKLGAYQTAIVLGFVERRGGLFLDSALVAQAGRVLGTYAKTHPNEQGFDAGTDYPVFAAYGWPFGINICSDANFPDAALNVSRQGARLLCFPLNNMLRPVRADQWRSKSVVNLQARAVETGCWVISSDVVGHVGNQMSYGCTCIVNPSGHTVARAPEGIEAAVLYDLR
jgi:predicted amidohydrolase